MARERKFQEVESNYAEPWSPENPGDSIEGEYKGFDLVPSGRGANNGKSHFRSYRILADGMEKPYGVAGSMLDSKLPRVPRGTYVKVTYIGQTKTNNGMAKDFKIECEAGTKLLDIDSED